MSDPAGDGQRTDAIILAGGRITDEAFREAAGGDCRALIDVLGKPMVQWVVEALEASPYIDRSVVLCRSDLKDTSLATVADEIVEEGTDEVDNLFRGLDALPGATQVLTMSADLPLLTPEAVNDLIENAPPEAEVVFPVSERADIERDFGDRKWVFVRTRDGDFTGSSCFLFRPEAVHRQREWVQRVFDARRDVWQLMRMWGLPFALKAKLGWLSLGDVEARVERVLGLRGRAYVTRFTELCMDVDKASDIGVVEERLTGRQNAASA